MSTQPVSSISIDILRFPHAAHCDVVVEDALGPTTIRVSTYVEALRLDRLIRRLRTGKRTRAWTETPETARELRRRNQADERKRAAQNFEHSRVAPLGKEAA